MPSLDDERIRLGWSEIARHVRREGIELECQEGSLYQGNGSPDVFEVHGEIRRRYRELHGPDGYMGFPITNEQATPDGRGRVSRFAKENSAIYFRPDTSAWEITGDVHAWWLETGGVSSAFGYPTAPMDTIFRRSTGTFENGQVTVTVKDAPFEIVWHNTALVYPFGYAGPDRHSQVDSLIENLQSNAANADVIGLCELMHDNQRERIVAALGRPWAEGPEGGNVPPNGVEDSGLLALSKSTFLHGTLSYQAHSAEDGAANKGALRVLSTGAGVAVDVTFSHTQNKAPDYGSSSVAYKALLKQIDVLYRYVESNSNPNAITLVMGDLNLDGNDRDDWNHLYGPARGGRVLDMWSVCGDRSVSQTGITNDAERHYEDTTHTGPRHTSGERLDHCIMWKGWKLAPADPVLELLVWQQRGGLDLSDHYGLRFSFTSIRQVGHTLARPPISSVDVRIQEIYCHDETNPEVGSDEVRVRIRVEAPTGAFIQGETGEIEINEGETATPDFHLTLPGDPRAQVTVIVSGTEDGDPLGDATTHVDWDEFFFNPDRTVVRTLRLLGDDSDYFVTIHVTANI